MRTRIRHFKSIGEQHLTRDVHNAQTTLGSGPGLHEAVEPTHKIPGPNVHVTLFDLGWLPAASLVVPEVSLAALRSHIF